MWTSYRWWLALAPSIGAILFQLARTGWRGIMNAQDVLINALGGAAVAFLGTIIISAFRSTRLLDEERCTEVARSDQERQRVERELEAVKTARAVSRLERERRNLVANRLRNAAQEDIAVYKHVLQHGQADPVMLVAGGLLDGGVTNPHLIDAAIQKGLLSQLLQSVPVVGKTRNQLIINPDLADALSFHLFGG